MRSLDAIVIGAGPAGSTTALRLAREGASVLLLDRAGFPRDKPCGGGLTGRALGQLPCSVEPVVEHVVDRLEVRFPRGGSVEHRSARPLILMTQRRRLDLHLAEQAVAAGAEFRDGARVGAIELERTGATVSVGAERFRCDALVGADGANGTTARAAALARDHAYGIAYEGNVEYGAARAERYGGRALLEFGAGQPGGYGWIFPKGNHVNVGVGAWLREGSLLRSYLARVLAHAGIDASAVEGLRGHRLPFRRPNARLAQGRVLLVGDAAGLVDPLSGDGMYECFVSARLASEAILDLLAGRAGSLEPYNEATSRELGLHLAASWGARRAIDRFPRPVFALLRLPFLWPVIEGLLQGELRHPGEARGVVRAPLRLIELLARAAGDPGRAYRLETTTG